MINDIIIEKKKLILTKATFQHSKYICTQRNNDYNISFPVLIIVINI